MLKHSLTQTTAPSNAQAFIPKTDNKITIRLIKDCATTDTGFTLLAGSVGTVIGLNDVDGRFSWVIDFGLPVVIRLPFDSPLIEIMRG